jgi:hypothetical protein
VELRELEGSKPDPSIDFAFSLLDTPPQEPLGTDWVHHWRSESGRTTISLARYGQGFLLRFPFLADFVISRYFREIHGWPNPGIPEDTLRHLLLDQVLPRLLSRRGHLVLHASAVKVGDRAVAFAGETGLGKSTLAVSFHLAGFPLLTDDGLMVSAGDGGVRAVPTYPGLRLKPESVAALIPESPPGGAGPDYSRKIRVPVSGGVALPTAPLSLGALYVLRSPEADGGPRGIEVVPLSPREACVELIRHAFQFDPTDSRQAAGVLELAGNAAESLPAFAISYPRDYSALAEVRDSILERVGDPDHPRAI